MNSALNSALDSSNPDSSNPDSSNPDSSNSVPHPSGAPTADAPGPLVPLVSILINNYNYEAFLQEAIESALNQTHERVEIVVVDDGSTDHSRRLIEHYAAIANRETERIVPIFKDNGGQASAFNAGIQASRGEIICFLDADDCFAIDKITRVVRLFERYPAAGWLFHELEEVDKGGKALPDGDRATIAQFSEADFRATLAAGGTLPFLPATSGLCFRHETLLNLGAVPEALRISADNFLRLSSACIAPGLLVPERWATHRMHGKNHYERRSNLQFLTAETDIKTSYYLRRQFPTAWRYADRLFAHALGQLIGLEGINRSLRLPEVQAYLQENLRLHNGLSCSLRTLYNYWRIGEHTRLSSKA